MRGRGLRRKSLWSHSTRSLCSLRSLRNEITFVVVAELRRTAAAFVVTID
jgi:hypothetical protein